MKYGGLTKDDLIRLINVRDEIITFRDNDIMNLNNNIKELNGQIADKNSIIAHKEGVIRDLKIMNNGLKEKLDNKDVVINFLKSKVD